MICFLTTDTAGEGIFRAGFLSKGRGKRRNNTILLCRHDGQNLLIFVSSFMWFMFFSGRCLEFDFLCINMALQEAPASTRSYLPPTGFPQTSPVFSYMAKSETKSNSEWKSSSGELGHGQNRPSSAVRDFTCFLKCRFHCLWTELDAASLQLLRLSA